MDNNCEMIVEKREIEPDNTVYVCSFNKEAIEEYPEFLKTTNPSVFVKFIMDPGNGEYFVVIFKDKSQYARSSFGGFVSSLPQPFDPENILNHVFERMKSRGQGEVVEFLNKHFMEFLPFFGIHNAKKWDDMNVNTFFVRVSVTTKELVEMLGLFPKPDFIEYFGLMDLKTLTRLCVVSAGMKDEEEKVEFYKKYYSHSGKNALGVIIDDTMISVLKPYLHFEIYNETVDLYVGVE